MLYPILTQSRLLMDLSGIWDFKPDDGTAFDSEWHKTSLSSPLNMPVPASYNDITESAALRDHYGWVFYQRTIAVPDFALSQRVVLRFSAIAHEAIVYLNDNEITRRKGGFLPFEIEISKHLIPGENRLTVAIGNIIDYTTLPVGGKRDMLSTGATFPDSKPTNHPNFDFFNYAGIIRPVALYTTPQSYIKDITVTAAVNGPDAVLSYSVETEGEGACHVEARDESGILVAESDGSTGTLEIKDVNLWAPLAPYLYDIKATFGEDSYTLPYGVRTVRVDGTKFLINEKPFYFKGYGKHEDTFPTGRGINIPMNSKDISLMKWQGANSFRTSHYPYSEEMMRLCDREGIVVIDETPAVGISIGFGGGANFGTAKIDTFDPEQGIKTFEHHKDVLRDLIARDKNYACVVMWSIANEPDSGAESAYDYFAPLYELALELDPQKRPRTIASVQISSPDKDCSSKLSDVICLNRYYGWYLMSADLVAAGEALRKEIEAWAVYGSRGGDDLQNLTFS
ncbi:MAG: beta-glucuronidase [Clostridiales bacterium]|nr:beta-glucuronidase [Clostridiales bacterium]